MKSQVKFGLLVIVVFIIALSMGLSGGIILDRRLGNNVTSASNNGINSNLDLNLISQALLCGPVRCYRYKFNLWSHQRYG
jgi:hypothetical protein